ncbi:MAG: NADPH:quinone reductase [Boseongicola sp. SB0676_bin_33]|nr:NADPH:quinone reductase [Boseongicola sp. SB0676_bin_33]
MRAITYESFGKASEVLTLEDLPAPTPASGEVLVRLNTSGANPSDVKLLAGGRPGVARPPFPKIIPHSDGAGVIEAVGDEVSKDRIGERVWIWNGQWRRAFGTAAEYIALPGSQAVVLPDNVSFEAGAVLGIPGLTACHAVLGGGPVEGKTVLVSGGAGTVGHLAIQIAAASDARVLATARGMAGHAAARSAGAVHVLDYASDRLADEILECIQGDLVDRIVEVEFGKNAETNARIIAERGTIATFGSALDMTPTLPFYPLMFKSVTIELLLVYLLSPERRERTIKDLTGLLHRDALKFRISDRFELANCAKAHDAIAAGGRAGSVILTI